MFENIVESIISSQFDCILGRRASADANPNHAMQVKFSLSNSYDVEDGHRHLTILLFGHGGRYIAVYAKVNWTVAANEPEAGDDEALNYVKGDTPWVCYGYHDSCWRDAVGNILREFHGRVVTINSLFNGDTGWYKNVTLTDEQVAELKSVRDLKYEGRGPWSWKAVSRLEFHFPALPHEHELSHCVAGSYCTVKGCNYVE